MRTTSKAAAALASGLAVAAGGAGVALAASQSRTAAGDQETFLQDVAGRLGVSETKLSDALKAAEIDHAKLGPPPFIEAAASYLGLTVSELQSDLSGGKTLAQVATAAGKSVDGLKAAIEADARSHLDKDVASGLITSAQEQDMLGGLEAHLDDIVNGTGPAGPGPGLFVGPGA